MLHSWTAEYDRFLIRDAVINIAIYIPAGLTGHLAFRKFRKPWLSLVAPVVIGTALSASIEMIQLFVPSRVTSALDLVNNIGGTVIGVFLGVMLEDFVDRRVRGATQTISRQADRSALSLLACWAVWLLFPLMPITGHTPIFWKFEIFLKAPVMDLVPFISALIAWFVVGSLMRAGGIKSARLLGLLSVLFIPAELFIVSRQPSPAALVGAVVGALSYSFFWPRRRDGRPMFRIVQAWAFLGVIVVRGLAPFTFVSEAFPFSFVPFAGFLGADWQTGVQLIAEKFFWYGTAAWLLRASGLRLLNATGIVAVILLVIEIAQTHLPGRTAEITDPLWGIVAGWSIFILGSGRAAQVPVKSEI